MQHSETIVVVGFGWVGQANALALAESGASVCYYDVVSPSLHFAKEYAALYERCTPLQSVLDKDGPDTVYLVCVGDRVLMDGTQDTTTIQKALGSLAGAKGKVVLRSTILAKNLEGLAFDYYVPEFLHEKYAVAECNKPHLFVLGMRKDRPESEWPAFLRMWKSVAHKSFIGAPAQASYIKYFSNIWNALRIAFVNELGDSMIGRVDDGKRENIEAVLDFLFERGNYLRYGGSYGGYCLPKDILTFFAEHQKEGKCVNIVRAAHESNLAHQAVERAFEDLPVYYSQWANEKGGRKEV